MTYRYRMEFEVSLTGVTKVTAGTEEEAYRRAVQHLEEYLSTIPGFPTSVTIRCHSIGPVEFDAADERR